MGTTIYYEGRVSSKKNARKILGMTLDLAKTVGWDIGNKSELSIILHPHEKSETFEIDFDTQLNISGSTKTVYAPIEIHVQLCKLLFQLRPLFEELSVKDDTGLWWDYEEQGDSLFDRIHSVDQSNASEAYGESAPLEVSYVVLTTPEETDKWFWTHDFESLKLHFPTLRDEMRKQLSKDKPTLITVAEIFRITDELELTTLQCEEGSPEPAFMALAALWAWNTFSGKPSERKRMKCLGFSWTLAEGTLGFHGGFLDKNHRQAMRLVNAWEEQTGDTQVEMTMKVVDALVEFYGGKMKKGSG